MAVCVGDDDHHGGAGVAVVALAAVRGHPVGESFKVEVIRDGKRLD